MRRGRRLIAAAAIVLFATAAPAIPIGREYQFKIASCEFAFLSGEGENLMAVLRCERGVMLGIPKRTWRDVWAGDVPPWPGDDPEIPL